MTPLPPPLAWTLAILVIVGAVSDARTRRIPNPIIVAGLAAGLCLHLWIDGAAGLWTSIKGLAVGLAIFLPLFLLRGMGGGDVKLMGAIGSITGAMNCVVVFVYTAILGGIIALALLLWNASLGRAIGNTLEILASLGKLRAPHEANPELSIDHPRSTKLPYAIPIALGSLLFLWASRT